MASETKRLSKWKSDWLHQKDGAGDSFSEYFVKSDEFNTKCLWCKKLIFHGSAGRAALSQIRFIITVSEPVSACLAWVDWDMRCPRTWTYPGDGA